MRAEYLHRKLILHCYNINNTVLFRSFKVKDSLNRSISLYVTSVIWRWETPGRWGNPPVHIISHFNLITFTSGGVTRRGLPHQPGVPHLHVNRRLDYFLKAPAKDSEHFPKCNGWANGVIRAPRLHQKRNGDLGLDQFFNRFSAMNKSSEHQDEANWHQGHGEYELMFFG